jgi:hypothetical protein
VAGIAIDAGWGLSQHYWIVVKLLITAFATIVLLAYMETFRLMASVAADQAAELALVRNGSPVVHAALALVALLVATALAVYEPWGLTPYGRSKQLARRSRSR